MVPERRQKDHVKRAQKGAKKKRSVLTPVVGILGEAWLLEAAERVLGAVRAARADDGLVECFL